ncbi:hypothetical protein AB0B01_02800 [Streptomyces sp. NPDC044571]|uniref:hypothetical protein n=1 Tax=Streptomyces sp. NPDC044571 TaxID=3155371 RepID=UPI0033E3704D
MSEQQPNPYTSDNGGPGNPGYGYPQPYPAAPGYQPTVGGAGIPAQPQAPAQPPAMPPAIPPAMPTGQPPAYAPAPAMGGGAGASGFSLGDITIAGDQIITPSGAMPLRGAMWNATDFSRTETKIPTHAVVLAIIFFLFCLLGLLFLLMKERTTTGYIQVTVTSGGRHHSTMVPATDPGTFHWVMSQVNYARSVSI